jgi:hypothetical protein
MGIGVGHLSIVPEKRLIHSAKHHWRLCLYNHSSYQDRGKKDYPFHHYKDTNPF